ncbi:MAG: AAA family ATPase, partial [Reyranella sp.]
RYDFAGRLEPRLDAPALVRRLLGVGTLAELYGESGSGTSHIALDLAMRVAMGMPALGRNVTRSAVVYVAGEGSYGLRLRIAAARARNLIDPGIPLAIVPRAVQMDSQGEEPRALVETCKRVADATDYPVRLVIVDTVARCLIGDENTAADMSRFVAACDFLRTETGATVLAVHHAGKDSSKGARGHSSLRAAVDTEILVEGRENPRTLTATKQRDLPTLPPIGFELDPVDLGTDPDGETVSACVVQLTGAPAPVRPEMRGRAQRQLLAALRAREPGSIWTIADLRDIGRQSGMHRNTAISVVDVLATSPYLTATVGGYRLAD